jgi:carbon monoxide dehydrogenase subunit G
VGSVVREIIIDAAPEKVWAAVGDFENGPAQTSPGVFVDCRLERPDLRVLTFADGTVARERLIARDEHSRRIVWGWVGAEVVHDNTSMQVFPHGEAQTRLVWIHDTLPDELTGRLAAAMDQLTPVFQQSLKSPT